MTGIFVALTGAVVGKPPDPPPPPDPFKVDVNSLYTRGNYSGGFVTVCSPDIYMTPSGGTGPYQFLSWTLIVGPAFTVYQQESGPPLWHTQFGFQGSAQKDSIYRATLRDSAGAIVTVDITVRANSTYFP